MATYFQSKTREFCIMKNFKKKLLVILLALTGSYFGYLLNLPIGTLVGSFIFIAIAKVIGLNVYPPPKKFKQKIQMVIGGLIGLNLQPNIASLFISLLIPGLIAATVHIIIAFLMAYLLMKWHLVHTTQDIIQLKHVIFHNLNSIFVQSVVYH